MSDYSFYDHGWTILEQLKQVNYALSLNNQTIDKFNEVTEELNKIISENLMAIDSTTSIVEQEDNDVHIKVYGKNLVDEEYVIFDSKFSIVRYGPFDVITVCTGNNDERFIPYDNCDFAGLYYKCTYMILVKQGNYSIPINDIVVSGDEYTTVEKLDNFTYSVQFNKYGTSTIYYGAILDDGSLVSNTFIVSCPQPDFATDTWNRIGSIARNETVIPYKAGDIHVVYDEVIPVGSDTGITYKTLKMQSYSIAAINHYKEHSITLVPTPNVGTHMGTYYGRFAISNPYENMISMFDEIYNCVNCELANELVAVPYPYPGKNYIYGLDGKYRDSDGNIYDEVEYTFTTYTHYIGMLNSFFRGSTYEGMTQTAPDGTVFPCFNELPDTMWDLPFDENEIKWGMLYRGADYGPDDGPQTWCLFATTPYIELDEEQYASALSCGKYNTLTSSSNFNGKFSLEYPLAYVCTIG